MKKRMFSVFTIIAFVIFSYSCLTTQFREEPLRIAPKMKIRSDARIIRIQMKSGESIEFSDKYSVEIDGDFIMGCLMEEIEIEESQITSTSLSEGNTYIVQTDQGKSYMASLKNRKYVGNEVVSILIEDVDLVWIQIGTQKVDPVGTAGAIVLVVMVGVIISIALLFWFLGQLIDDISGMTKSI